MARQKKQHLKKRQDGYYCCRYKDQFFYSLDEDDALAQREEYKRQEALQLPSIQTVKEFAEKWIDRAYPSVAKTTKAQLHIHLKKLTDAIGDKLLTEVKSSDIKDVYSSRYLGLSQSYIVAAKQLYCALFDAAVADRYISVNPARDKTAKPHKGTVGGHRQITPQERHWIETLCTDHRAWPAVMTMLYSGIRPQEAKALKIDRDVDFESETISLSEFAHIADANHYELTKEGKTDKAARTIPLFPPLKEALSGRKGYLITSAKGQQVSIQAWKSAWESYVCSMETAINGCSKRWYRKTKEHKKILAEAEALREAGKEEEARRKEMEIPPWIEFTVVPYDLRHSFCCMCRDNHVELKTCVRWMGHADAKMILKIYDEASDNRSEKEAERLKKTLFRSINGSIEKKKRHIKLVI